jgi:hypothetical protein
MVVVAQLVRVLVCGAEGRRFEPGQPPRTQKLRRNSRLFLWTKVSIKIISNLITFNCLDFIKLHLINQLNQNLWEHF